MREISTKLPGTLLDGTYRQVGRQAGDIYVTNVVCNSHTFKDIFGMKHKFAKYLKKS